MARAAIDRFDLIGSSRGAGGQWKSSCKSSASHLLLAIFCLPSHLFHFAQDQAVTFELLIYSFFFRRSSSAGKLRRVLLP